MSLIDIILAIYPLYLSIEYIRSPDNMENMKHCLIFWILWFSLTFLSDIVNYLFWWVPFTSILSIIKVLILLFAYQSNIAKSIQTNMFNPIWDKFNNYFPPIIRNILNVCSLRFPFVNMVRYKINTFVKDFIGIIDTTNNISKHRHFIDVSQQEQIPENYLIKSSKTTVKFK